MIGSEFMEPVHIVTEKDNISELVLMPGDPLRAKFIAENFLEDAVLVNDVRNMLGYTGTYKGVRVTVIGSGMGIPSIGIYSYELAKFYGVKKIIRVGSAGAMREDVHVRDIVVADEARSVSSYALAYNGDASNTKYASKSLLEDIRASVPAGVTAHFGSVITSDVFDVYSGSIERSLEMLDYRDFLASEMEAFGLYFIGELTGIETATILTITNSEFTPLEDLSHSEREQTLKDMIILALEAIIK